MSNYIDLPPAEFVQRRESGELWQLLDVREAWEVELSSVGPAVHIPLGELPARHPELDRDRPLAVLCHSGGRSARAAAFLCACGFEPVANIAGGIDAWSLTVDANVPRY